MINFLFYLGGLVTLPTLFILLGWIAKLRFQYKARQWARIMAKAPPAPPLFMKPTTKVTP